ncbi:imidazoleglycerol-phosphate dehydratase HisB [Haliangium sp.]|uniref:imidazoleglycerol-phosphate dehydratase HisB n=1 Tax=Haliangium sp. TaxID=2663208 RepID=UPI003D0D627C
MSSRRTRIDRTTAETQIQLELGIDGAGERHIDTQLPFLGHMLEAFSRHGLFDLSVQARGDIEVDPHHTVEDIGLCLGMAFKDALGDRAGLVRYGSAIIPMDETLVTCAVDFCGRPAFVWKVEGLERRRVGSFDCELAHEFFAAFATRAECNLHVLLHYGKNAHHIIEAIFKAFARACDAATRIDARLAGKVPSTKGTLTA